ncbi:MAG: helix-turn-helix transcriptional regulator [Steroidobacteraceae bacterium]
MNNDNASLTFIQVIRLPRVLQMTGLCRSTIYQLEADEKFPKRVQLAPRAVGWVEHEIQGWLAKRIEDRSRPVAP